MEREPIINIEEEIRKGAILGTRNNKYRIARTVILAV